MKISFLGDYDHPNAQSWIKALREYGQCEVIPWSLPLTQNRQGRIMRVMHWARSLWGIKNELKKVNPDLVIAYRITSYGFIGAISGFHPLVIASQGGGADVWPLGTLTTPVKRQMASYSLKKADMIHAWAEHMADAQRKLGANPSKILILPRGIDLDKFYALPEAPNNLVLQIVVTRSLYLEYCHDVIFRASAMLKQNAIPFTLHIVGTGSEMDNLKELAKQLEIAEEVVFHGAIPNDTLPDLLRNCNIYTSMTRSEGVSASLLEAMACGCYPVVSDLPANRFWIENDRNGALVPIDNSETLYAAFRRYLDNAEQSLAARNYNIGMIDEKASIKKNIGIFVEHYSRLVRSHKKQYAL